jgi:transcriptional regulator of heat shock response
VESALKSQITNLSAKVDSESPTSVSPSQTTVRRLKYELCKNWRETGCCRYGEKCLFAHGKHELTNQSEDKASEIKLKV